MLLALKKFVEQVGAGDRLHPPAEPCLNDPGQPLSAGAPDLYRHAAAPEGERELPLSVAGHNNHREGAATYPPPGDRRPLSTARSGYPELRLLMGDTPDVRDFIFALFEGG